jgi:glutathione S-transferase
MLTVWGRVNSINVQKVLWTLAEVGIDYRRIDAGMKFGVNNTPEYLAMNPNGLVPTIDDDGLILWESNVIVRYLAARYGGALYPADLAARFSAERWMDWQATTFGIALTPIFAGLIRKVTEYSAPETIAAARRKCESCLAILDHHLARHRYMNGDDFSMADIPVGATVNRWYRLPIEREPRPHVTRWLDTIAARPGFRAHLDLPLS